jgi:H+/Cl- antiporter ClcA
MKKYINSFYIEFLLYSLIIGFFSILFSIIVDYALNFCNKIFNYNNLYMFFYTPILFVIVVVILRKIFPYSDGSGIPQGYLVDSYDKYYLKKIYSIYSSIGKALLTFISILAGASLGKEGPTVQVSSSLLAQIKNISDNKKRLLIKIGSGVGVAAAFNTPIGGMVFALEEYIKQINPKIATQLIAATFIAVSTVNLINGSIPYIGFTNHKLLFVSKIVLLISAIMGILVGICGVIFTKIVIKFTIKDSLINRFRQKHYILTAIIFGFLVGLIGYFTKGLSFGNGAILLNQSISNNELLPWYFAIAKFLGAIFSISAGVVGGYFSTGLSIGAGIGAIVYKYFSVLPLLQFYLLGMVAFISAITQSPITAVAMVVEMSNSSEFCIALLLSAFLSSFVSELFGGSVYHQQIIKYKHYTYS